MAEEAGRVDRKEGAMGRGYFTDGMPGWKYFPRATPGHPAGMIYYVFTSVCLSVVRIIRKFKNGLF